MINEARALLGDATAIIDQLNNIYGRLKANNHELNQINEELGSHIADEEFNEDNATSLMTELFNKLDRNAVATSSTPKLPTASSTAYAISYGPTPILSFIH
ncbi:hypothetical protein HPB52_024007 [Rhipicephalus sanguineus]|uniref:Uncharacterized protein n=1 Tax=Rhipicephalus sanguineus TaxID=34632 RepID=A0A9D4SVN3_RHISA|nr:hypothetical protein HPB52_024007 [Rhipicephalus sanguineus]